MATEFRVVWKREGRRQSTRIFQSGSSAYRKAQGILALEAVKGETEYETMPDLEERPTIQQRSVGEWEPNPFGPSESDEGIGREMLYLYGRKAAEASNFEVPF
jgi:hypothetical protein